MKELSPKAKRRVERFNAANELLNEARKPSINVFNRKKALDEAKEIMADELPSIAIDLIKLIDKLEGDNADGA